MAIHLGIRAALATFVHKRFYHGDTSITLSNLVCLYFISLSCNPCEDHTFVLQVLRLCSRAVCEMFIVLEVDLGMETIYNSIDG